MLLLDALPRHLGMFALASQGSRIVLLVLPFLRSETAVLCAQESPGLRWGDKKKMEHEKGREIEPSAITRDGTNFQVGARHSIKRDDINRYPSLCTAPTQN